MSVYKANGLWYKQRDTEMLESLKRGVSVREVARKWHLEESSVRAIVRHYGEQEALTTENTNPKEQGAQTAIHEMKSKNKTKAITECLDGMSKIATGNKRTEALEQNKCVVCGKPAVKFKDIESAKEYDISGLCQACQDEFFVEDEERISTTEITEYTELKNKNKTKSE